MFLLYDSSICFWVVLLDDSSIWCWDEILNIIKIISINRLLQLHQLLEMLAIIIHKILVIIHKQQLILLWRLFLYQLHLLHPLLFIQLLHLLLVTTQKMKILIRIVKCIYWYCSFIIVVRKGSRFFTFWGIRGAKCLFWKQMA